MRRLFVIALIALLLGVGIVALIETDPGYILLSYGRYTLETSLWVGLVLAALALLLLYIALRLVYRVLGGRRNLVSWWGSRLSGRAQRNTGRGVISFIEGNWALARRQLLRGARDNDAPLLNYLLAARASDHLEERERVAEYLEAALQAEPSAAAATAITNAEIKLRAGEYAAALSLLDGAQRAPRALTLTRQACEGLEDWDRLLQLLPALKKHGHMSEQEALQLELDVHSHRLRAARTEGGGVQALHGAWQKVPAALKQDRELLHFYVRRQVELGADADAEKTILRALKQQWDPALVRQFGLLQDGDSQGRLQRAERWLPEHPQDAQLLLCLGRLSAREKLWGKAREYFENSYRVELTAEICAELGRLLQALGEPKVAAAYFREGLHKSTSLPQLPLPEATTTPAQRLA